MEAQAPYAEAVAAAVREAISTAGKTPNNVATGTGIPAATLHRRLTGKSPFTVTELDHIATDLGVTVEQLIAPKVAA